ncbi:MAG: PAS domain-containing protein, partial [Anaerolineae bacterium]
MCDIGLQSPKQRDERDVLCTNGAVDTTLRAIPEAMLVADASGQVRCFNPAAEALTGSSAAHVLGRSYGELFVRIQEAGSTTAEALSEVLSARQVTGPIGVRWQGTGDEESSLELALTASPILEPDGSVSGMVVMLQELRQQIAVEYAQSGFFSLVSHELRSRLTSISTSAELLLGLDLDAAQSREILDVVRTQSRRLASFFERLMDADVLQSGQVTVRAQPLAVLPLIRMVVARFEAE